MFIYIPGWFISFVTFPGVVLHEIAHRFFCDINDVLVYDVCYFRVFSKQSGHVVHAVTDNPRHMFFIAIAPLIINTLVCMICTFQLGCNLVLGTSFVDVHSTGTSLVYYIMTWIGFSAGIHAMPSNQDMKGLIEKARRKRIRIPLYIFTKIVALFNEVGAPLGFLYALMISFILPILYMAML